MSRFELAAVASACYALTASDDAWLAGVVEQLVPMMDAGAGVAAWSFQVGHWDPPPTLPVGVSPEIGRAMHAAGARAPEPLARQFFMGPRTLSATERIGRETPLSELPAFEPLLAHGIADFNALTLLDASGAGLAFAAPAPEVLHTSRQLRRRLDRIGAHILAGFRLRRALGAIDAVLEADGKLVDAQGEARTAQHQETLRAAVQAFDRASLRQSADSDQALEAWRALVAGRWSLVQSFESDGRRYLLARRNPPGNMAESALSALEAQALLLRAQGASLKLIAYELGISAAAVHRMMQKGRAKLGIRNENELPSFLAQQALGAAR